MHVFMHGRFGRNIDTSFFSQIFTRGERIAEFGCGNGYFCKYLKEYASILYCVDINDLAIEEAKKNVKGENIIFLNENSSHTSIEKESLDTVFFANSFHDMDRESTYKEVLRVLKKKGKVVIIDWEKKETEFGPPIDIRMSKEDYLKVFRDFVLEKEFAPGPYHYGLVLRKA